MFSNLIPNYKQSGAGGEPQRLKIYAEGRYVWKGLQW
jgi:hypothetical protein